MYKRETNIELSASAASRLFSGIEENSALDDIQTNTIENVSCFENTECKVETVDEVIPENNDEVSSLSDQKDEIIQDIIQTTQEESSFENNENIESEQKNWT